MYSNILIILYIDTYKCIYENTSTSGMVICMHVTKTLIRILACTYVACMQQNSFVCTANITF